MPSCCSTGGCYSSVRTQKVVGGVRVGEKSHTEIGCLTVQCCLGVGLERFGWAVGGQKDDKLCTISMPCAACGLKKPETICSGDVDLFCLHLGADLPKSGAQLPEQVTACCCVRCTPPPTMCLVPPFSAPDLASMTRN